MKTTGKILCAVGAVVLVLGGTACYFSGVPYYLKAEKEFGDYSLDWTFGDWIYADKGIPSEAESMRLTFNGVSLSVPKDMKQGEDSDSVYKTEKDADGRCFGVVAFKPDDMGEFSFNDLDGPTEKRVEKYLHSIGQEMPHNWCDLFHLLYTLKREDCDLHNYTNSGIFYLLQKIKSEAPVMGSEQYFVNLPTASGTAGIIHPGEYSANYRISLDLYERDDQNCSHCIFITAPDLDSACKIVNSIELVPYEAPEPEPEPEPRELTEEEQQVIDSLLERIGELDADD